MFAYIEMLRKTDFKEYTFKEAQAMAQIDFDWKNPAEGMGYVAGRAALMQNYKLSEVETLQEIRTRGLSRCFGDVEAREYAGELDESEGQNG